MTVRFGPREGLWGYRGPGAVVLLDNRDSFVYNLAHRFYELGVSVSVVRSDAITLAELRGWRPRALVVSPGPGHPDDAGVSMEAIRHFSPDIPILGVCLGHQAIGRVFGADVVASGAPCHGRSCAVEHDGRDLFEGIASPMEVGRYHSLIVREPLPEALEVTARGAGFVMGLRHRERATFGVQFHPESVLTPEGLGLLGNFVRWVR